MTEKISGKLVKWQKPDFEKKKPWLKFGEISLQMWRKNFERKSSKKFFDMNALLSLYFKLFIQVLNFFGGW